MTNEFEGGIPAGEMAVLSATTEASKSAILVRSEGESHEEYIERLITHFHASNGMPRIGQAIGLLRTIAETCQVLAMHLIGQQRMSFSANPFPGLFYQFDTLRQLFPTAEEDVTFQGERIARMYYLTAEECDKAEAMYLEQGVTLGRTPAAELEGVLLYTLEMLKHEVPEGQKSALQEGQKMWYNDPEKQPAPIHEASWNPFYVEPPVAVESPAVNLTDAAAAANDTDVALKVGDEVLESPAPGVADDVASDLEVKATGEISPELAAHIVDMDVRETYPGTVDVSTDESGCEAEGEEEDLCEPISTDEQQPTA